MGHSRIRGSLRGQSLILKNIFMQKHTTYVKNSLQIFHRLWSLDNLTWQIFKKRKQSKLSTETQNLSSYQTHRACKSPKRRRFYANLVQQLKTIPATKGLSATTNEACCNFGFQACGNFIMQTDLSNQKLLMTSDTKFSNMYRTFQSSSKPNQTFEIKPKLRPSKEKKRLSRMLLQQDQELWAPCSRFYVQVSATRVNAGCISIFNHRIQELTQTLN